MSLYSDRDHGQAISACIDALLEKEALKLEGGHNAQTMSAIVNSIKRAIADYTERWNARFSAHLPPELLALCFGMLPFEDLMTVSRVSRHWHAVALGTPELWATFRIGSGGRERRKLTELLRRSQAAPLSIELTLTPNEEALLHPHFPRLRELVCANPPWGPLDMPMLRKLRVTVSPGRKHKRPVALSAQYIAGAANSLETLQLEGFVLEPSCPVFRSLRSFSAVFTSPQLQEGCLSSLLALCPALESLSVRWQAQVGSTSASVPRALFVPLPPLLRDVYISGLDSADSGVDCATLQLWAAHPFRRLRLDGLQRISGVLEWFSASYSPQPWSLELFREDTYLVCSLRTLAPTQASEDTTHRGVDSQTRTDIVVKSRGANTEPRLAQDLVQSQPHFQRLTACTLTLRCFLPLVRHAVSLPALASFTLAVHPKHDRGNLPPADISDSESGAGIAAPLLRSFVLVCHRDYVCPREVLEWFYGTLPRRLRTWMLYDAPRLERLTLEGRVRKSDLTACGGVVKDSKIYELAEVVQRKRYGRTY